MKFNVEHLEGALRFKADDGWIDLALLGDGKAQIWCGTFNGTDPTVFGSRLWHLLKDVLPTTEIRVVSYEDIEDSFVEQILVGAGFTKEGTRRQWGSGGQDVVLYSILASEVVHEAVTIPEVGEKQDGQLLPA